MEEIDQAEKRAAGSGGPGAESPGRLKPAPGCLIPTPAVSAELLKQRQLDATFAMAMAPVEGRVAGWDFQGALQESEKVRFDAPELTTRLASRREQIRRMADLKDRMIAAINQADPHLKKADLMLRGINGEIDKADAEGISATLLTGKQESLAWAELGPKAAQQAAATRRAARKCRRLAGGRPAEPGGPGCPQRRAVFRQGAVAGRRNRCPIRPCWRRRDFAAVRDLLDKHKYAESESLLTALEAKYGKLPWFAANKPELDAAAKEAKRGLREKEAEGSLRPGGRAVPQRRLVRTEAGRRAAQDPVCRQRRGRRSAAKAVAGRVGEGGCRSRPAGPRAEGRQGRRQDHSGGRQRAPPAMPRSKSRRTGRGPSRSWFPPAKEGLTIRGKKGLLPVITTAGRRTATPRTSWSESPQLSLERLAIVRADSGSQAGTAITADDDCAFLPRGGRVRAYAGGQGRRRQGLRLFRARRLQGVLLAARTSWSAAA